MKDLTPLLNANLSRELQLLLYLVGYWAQKGSFRVYAVGGFVRDLLLGRENRDIDLVVVNNSAVDFARSLQEIMPGELRCYERFGTATLRLPKKIVFDMVTARKEFYAAPGALPDVEYSSLRNDLYRRDFTINTMACALNPDSFGELHDYFGGEKDLKEGLLRVLYKLSFLDDPLRILRALRFEQRFNFVLEEETLALLRGAVAKQLFRRVSKERLYQEVRLIFREPSPSQILRRMHDLGLFGGIFPRVLVDAALPGQLKNLESLFQDWEQKGRGGDLNPIVLYLGLLFQGLSEHDLKYLSYLMRLRREERQKIFTIYERLPVLASQLRLPYLKPSELYALLEGLPPEGLLISWALEGGGCVAERILNYWEHLIFQKPRLKGKDLLQMGIKPGPLYRQILGRLQEAVLNEKVSSREEEIALLNSYVKEMEK